MPGWAHSFTAFRATLPEPWSTVELAGAGHKTCLPERPLPLPSSLPLLGLLHRLERQALPGGAPCLPSLLQPPSLTFPSVSFDFIHN